VGITDWRDAGAPTEIAVAELVPADSPRRREKTVALPNRYEPYPANAAWKESGVTAAEFERLTATEVECLLRRRLNLFVNAGATPCAALILAAQVEIAEEEAVRLLEFGFSVDLTLRLLYEAAA
jgi:hypothetical protein